MFSQLKKCIVEMDKNKRISSDFGNYIITNLTSIAKDNNKSEVTIVRDIIELLYSFLYKDDALKFVLCIEDKKILICQSIFNIGMDSIENNQEDSLRLVSNALGWLTINSIDRGDDSVVKYLLNRSIDLFKISKSLSISDKTLAFIMTLFTTVGTYSCKNPKFYRYRSIIIDALLEEDELVINTAIKLRTSENNNWNELFDNKTEELTKEFLKAYKSEKQRQNKKSSNKRDKSKDMNLSQEVAIGKN